MLLCWIHDHLMMEDFVVFQFKEIETAFIISVKYLWCLSLFMLGSVRFCQNWVSEFKNKQRKLRFVLSWPEFHCGPERMRETRH